MVPGTGGVAAVGPGDPSYRGAAWKVFVVSWNTTMRPLTSQSAIFRGAGGRRYHRDPERGSGLPLPDPAVAEIGRRRE